MKRSARILPMGELPQREEGVVMIIAALLIVSLIIFVSLSLNFSFANLIRTETQSVADSASHAAALTLCSSRDCYNRSLITAIRSINEQVVHGGFGHQAVIDLSAALQNLEQSYASTLGDTATAENVSGGPTWEVGSYRVTVQRGRWWPDGAPNGIETLPDEQKFEPFDLVGQSWQAKYPAVPNFLAANAVRVVLEQRAVNWLLTPLRSMRGEYDIVGRSIAIGGQTDQDTCVAPFAIPACALLDRGREYDAKTACQFDRFFTAPQRYCAPGSEDCDVVPGAWWSPLTSIYCEEPWATLFPNRCNCYKMKTDPNYHPEQKLLCGDYAGFPSIQCSFFPYPTFGRTSQHYGVVGLPERVTAGPPEESAIQDIVGSAEHSCVPARIHDRFFIRKEGLSQLATEDLLWKQMTDQFDDSTDEAHPLQAQTDLGTSVVISRAKDFEPYPIGPVKKFTDYLIAHGLASAADFAEGATAPCPKAGLQQFGACNSRRYAYDERCSAWWLAYLSPASEWNRLGTPRSRQDWSFMKSIGSVPPVLTWPDGQGGTLQWTEWRDGYPANPEFPFDCQNNLPYFPCPFPHHQPFTNQDASPYYTESDTAVWQIAIPVIADYSAVISCATDGHNDSVIDPNSNWRIIGFVRVNLFDADIGRPPPKPPGSNYVPPDWPGPPSWVNWVRQNLNFEPPRTVPPVCPQAEGRQPWAFAPQGPGSEQSCNMVRGRTACDTGLIASGDLQGEHRQIRFVR